MKQLIEALPVNKRKEIKLWAIVTSASFIGAIVFVVAFLSVKYAHLFEVKKSFNQLNYAVGDFNLRLKEKTKLEVELKKLEKKFGSLKKHSANGAKVASVLLETVCNVMPEQLFLDKFDFDYKKQSLRLTGFCQDVFLLTHFVDKLAEFDFCRDVKLEKLSRSEFEDYNLLFVVLLQLKEF